MPKHSWLRRHLPFMLFLVALSSLMVALTRPVAIMTVPTTDTTVILAIDASRSMCSTDIQPNRLEAAKAAALEFIQGQNSNTKIGLVAFGSFAAIIQPPTTDQEMLQDAVQSIDVGRRTAMGSGILKSIDAIAETNKNIAPSDMGATSTSVIPTPVPKGAYAPAIIVVLTDGVSNVGPLPVEAAQEAADRGIRVYTIGFGTDSNDSIPQCGKGFQGTTNNNAFGNGNNPFGGGGATFGGFRRGIDEDTLKQVSDLTGGAYYPAESASELQHVFQNLPVSLIVQHETMEISVAFTALGALLAFLAIALSFAWHPLT